LGAELIEGDNEAQTGEILWQTPADMLIVDLTQSGDNINSSCRKLKKEIPDRETLLMIIITEAQLATLDLGIEAEDFVLKRDDFEEAVTRIKRMFHRKTRCGNTNVIEVEDLVIDLDNYEASIKGQPIYLTFKEFELLKFLILNRGRVFNRDSLLDRVWGYDNYVGTRTVDIHIQRLRNKLGCPIGDKILTVRNVGYKFAAP
jgi:DNA-binding response OmpR family regulator